MSFLNKLRGKQPAPRLVEDAEGPKGRRGSRAYDSASGGYRTDGWTTTSSDANSEIDAGLSKIRDRSRDAVRNQPLYGGAVTKVANKIVGTGIRPDLNTGNPELDKEALALFAAWSKRCHAGSRSNFAGLQSLLATSFVASGEVLARRVWKSSVKMRGLPPIQIQAIESDMLDHTLTQSVTGGGEIIQGVQLDADGERAFYHLHRSHPGAMIGAVAYNEIVPVPAADMLHLMHETRPGQVRSTPMMQGLIAGLYDMYGYMDTERYRSKNAASSMAWVEDMNPDMGSPVGVDGLAPAVDSDGDAVTDIDGVAVEQFRPGMIAYLGGGKTVKFNQPNAPSGFSDYVTTHLHELAAGSPLSYAAFTGDLTKTSFASIKFGLTEQNEMIRTIRELVFVPLALDPIWEWFVDAAIVAGLLPNVAELYNVTWSRPMTVSADRLTDAKADQLEMRTGTSSRRELIAARGKDPDAVDADIKLDKDNREELGIVSDGDPAQVSEAGLFQHGFTDDDTEESSAEE